MQVTGIRPLSGGRRETGGIVTALAHLAPSGPPGEPPRSGWQCPACLTVYNPDVKACHCAIRKPLSERLKQDRPIRLGGGLIRFPR